MALLYRAGSLPGLPHCPSVVANVLRPFSETLFIPPPSFSLTLAFAPLYLPRVAVRNYNERPRHDIKRSWEGQPVPAVRARVARGPNEHHRPYTRPRTRRISAGTSGTSFKARTLRAAMNPLYMQRFR